jgi:hypothetical protein
MLRAAVLALLSLPLVPAALSDVIAVAPGSAVLDASRVRESTDTTNMFFTRDGQERGGPMQIESTRRMTRDGAAVFEHRIVVLAPGGRAFIDDTTWYNASTLAPIAHRSHSTNRSFSIDYAPGRVTGFLKDSTGTRPIDVTLAQPVFDPSELQSLVRSLPIKVGTAFALPLFDHQKYGIQVDTLVVEGAAEVETDGGKVAAWRLGLTTADRKATYYLAQDTGRELKVDVTWAGGAMRVVGTGVK